MPLQPLLYVHCPSYSVPQGDTPVSDAPPGSTTVDPSTLKIWARDASTWNPVTTGTGAAIGYAAGAGGTVTQPDPKTSPVTLNALCGQIICSPSVVGNNNLVSFQFFNTFISATDYVHVWVASGAAMGGSYIVWTSTFTDGSCLIHIDNIYGNPLSEAIVLGFCVVKAVTS